MRIKYLLIPCLFVFCALAWANDRVKVNLPYSVTVADKVLPPGEYEIKQLDSNGGARHIVQVFSDDGMKFETTVMTIPALDNRTPEESKVVLHRFGDDYYFDKMWVQGKNYGYEFPVPAAVKSRERERRAPVDVAVVQQPEASKESSSTTTTESSTTTRSITRESTEIAQARPQERRPEPTPPAETPAPAPATTPAPAAQTPATPAPSTEAQPATPARPAEEMPQTAANWLTMLLGGGALSALGLKLRRR